MLSAAFAALTAIFAKVGVEQATLTSQRSFAPSLSSAWLRQYWPQPASGSRPFRTYVFLVLSGLATGGSWLCYFRALKLGDAARVAPIDKLSVVLVAVFGVIFLGERLSGANWLGVALIALGAVLVAYRV